MAMNLVVLTGRLTRDPELKYTQGGKAVVNFTVAVSRLKKDEADFINCVAWDKTGELVAEYFRKGSLIGLQGRIVTGSYEKDGQKRYTTEVYVDKIEFLESKKSGATENYTADYEAPSKDKGDMEEDEFPF